MRIPGILVVAIALASSSSSQATARKVQPGVFVTVASSAIDDAERAWHADGIRGRLAGKFENTHVDINVAELGVAIRGNDCEVTTQINFVLSTTSDQIVSVGTGTAKITLPKRQAVHKLPELRREAIDSALADMLQKLRRQ